MLFSLLRGLFCFAASVAIFLGHMSAAYAQVAKIEVYPLKSTTLTDEDLWRGKKACPLPWQGSCEFCDPELLVYRRWCPSTGPAAWQATSANGRNFSTPWGYPAVLGLIGFHDFQHDRPIVFLTHSFELSALQIARLYKRRWQVELFFKWIKRNPKIKAFVGHSANAVKSQIWVAATSYVLVAI